MTNTHQAHLAHTHTIIQQGYLFVSYTRINSQTVQKKNHNSYSNNAHTYKRKQLHTLDHVNIPHERHIQLPKTSSSILFEILKTVILLSFWITWDTFRSKILTYLFFFVSIGFCYVSLNRCYIVMFSRIQLISLPLYFILWKRIYHHLDEVRTLLFFSNVQNSIVFKHQKSMYIHVF